MIGKQQTKITSGILVPNISHNVREAVILFFVGALAMFIHARFRWGASLPGHHGLEFMAILMASRINVQMKWSSVFITLGIGTMIALPFMGFKNPVTALGYLLPVIVLDIFYSNLKDRWRKVWLLAIIGGVAYMAVPMYRILLMAVGFPYPVVIKYGSVVAPLAGFFSFGFLGAGFAAGLFKAIKRKRD